MTSLVVSAVASAAMSRSITTSKDTTTARTKTPVPTPGGVVFEQENFTRNVQIFPECDASSFVHSQHPKFGSRHLASLLITAFPAKVAMTSIKTKIKAFKGVYLSSKSDGTMVCKVHCSSELAERISNCIPHGSTTARGLLFWLEVSATMWQNLSAGIHT